MKRTERTRGICALAIALLIAAAAPATLADDQVIGSGTWTKKSSSIQGGWKIVERDGRHFIQLDDIPG